MHGCNMTSLRWYSIFVYVEAVNGLDNDGALFGPLRFQAIQASNDFTAKPMASGLTKECFSDRKELIEVILYVP